MASNFGVLNKGLQGSHLRIGDKLVIDRDTNILVGNIGCGTLTTHEGIFTPALVEDKSFEGIQLHGNLIIQPGSFLIGDVDMSGVISGDLTVGGTGLFGGNIATGGALFTSVVHPETTGGLVTLSGNVRMSQNLSVSSSITADVLLVDNLIAQPSSMINVLGSIHLVDSTTHFQGNLHTLAIASANSSSPITIAGGIDLISGCFSIPKEQTLPSSVSGSTSTPAGVLIFQTASSISPFATATIVLVNPCIHATSVILCNIGSFTGTGIPIVQSISPAAGTASIRILNSDPSNSIPAGTNIPINFLIV